MVTFLSTALQLMNKMKPIWMRSPKEVKEEEYAEFYKSTFKAWDEVAAHTHFSLEGQVEFRALLFVPSVLPYELSRNMFDETSRNMRLYVKRVFINDKFEELIPRWLLFLRGVVSWWRCLRRMAWGDLNSGVERKGDGLGVEEGGVILLHLFCHDVKYFGDSCWVYSVNTQP